VIAGVEIEVKLAVDDPERIEALVRRPRTAKLAGFAGTGRVRRVEVMDRYLDTRTGALEEVLARARLRESRGSVQVTFKRQGVQEQGVTTRVELEADATRDLDPARWPDSPARRELLAIVGNDTLVETARLRQQRLVRDLVRGTARVELSLDRLEALDGDVIVATRWELEAELKAGRRDDLVELANALQVLPGLSLAAESKRLFAMLAVQRARAGVAASVGSGAPAGSGEAQS
jgi:inorganic triphosphatase YgiF